MNRLAMKLAVLAALMLAPLLAPAAANAACALPGSPDPDMSNVVLDVEGNLDQSRAGGYLQIPFTVPSGTTAIQVRYSYDQPGDGCSAPPGGPSSTLDIGLYEPRDAGETVWGMDESRGWSGSAVRNLSVAGNGFSDEVTYNGNRKAFVSERTTRAYRPGPIPEGEWAVELGVAFVAPDLPTDAAPGIDYRVEVRTTTDPGWSDEPYQPSGYSAAPVRTTPGWYAGDFHVHGEQEPGNATMTQTFAAAFDSPAAGAGLDFVTLVDHNNNVAHDNLADYQAAYPDKLIVPGVEETTYRGHHNNHGKGPLSDFRGGPILQPPDPPVSPIADSALTQVRGAVTPAQAFAEETAAGNLAQVNHPQIFKSNPSLCRGCAWSYDATETDYSKVDSIEIQTGPAAVPSGAPAAPNPFIADTLAFYESALATGAHIAAVGSSDDHQGAEADGPFDSPVGSATTMVYADELSEQGLKAAVRGAHTYVKFFGPNAPDVTLEARGASGDTAIIGDTLAVPGADTELAATVTGTADTGRPGTWALTLLRNGAPVETVPVASNDFAHSFAAGGAGRYSLEVTRTVGVIDFTEIYTSPIWLEEGGASNDFRILKVKRNKKKGTAKLIVRIPGAGKLTASGKKLEKDARTPGKAGKVKLAVDPKGKAVKKLHRSGEAKVKPHVRYRPEGGESRMKKKKVVLKLRDPKN